MSLSLSLSPLLVRLFPIIIHIRWTHKNTERMRVSGNDPGKKIIPSMGGERGAQAITTAMVMPFCKSDCTFAIVSQTTATIKTGNGSG